MLATRRASRYEKGGDLPEVEATRWCVPVLCLGLGLLVAPAGLFLGNELGADLRVVAADDLLRAGLRPVLRYASGAFRTPSIVGVLAPEVGVVNVPSAGAAQPSLVWSLLPADYRLGDVAIGFDLLRAGVLLAAGGLPSRGELGSELTLRYAP